jgi:hypothetical protein
MDNMDHIATQSMESNAIQTMENFVIKRDQNVHMILI